MLNVQYFPMTTSCPIPISQYPHVLMAHGGGGKLMHQLLEEVFGKAFSNPILAMRHDSAQFDVPSRKLAMTTDSYVVRPIFFPGGDIGSMAVHGTVNDLAMGGARPVYLSAAFIIEEGLPMDTLWRVVCSMRDAAQRCGAQIVTGDTKVVDKGKGDGLFINTAGIGVIEHPLVIAPRSVRPGDAVLVSGDLGRHGMAIMAVREGLQFESAIESDSAPVHEIILELLKAGIEIHCLRDLTRGGLASALNEIAEGSGVRIEIVEKSVPVREDVHAACDLDRNSLPARPHARRFGERPQRNRRRVGGAHRNRGKIRAGARRRSCRLRSRSKFIACATSRAAVWRAPSTKSPKGRGCASKSWKNPCRCAKTFMPPAKCSRSEERRVGKEGRSRWSP